MVECCAVDTALVSALQPEDESGQLDYRYDEFGFKVEEEGWLLSTMMTN